MEMIQTRSGWSPTIDDMIAVEPRIGHLLNEANIPTDAPYWHRYSHYKRLLSQYVGWDAKQPELATNAAYETMIRALETALASEKREGK